MPVNGESKQWHERPAIFKSNLKSILVFVKHSPGFVKCRTVIWGRKYVVDTDEATLFK